MTCEPAPIVAVVGPTGSGKSALGLEIAREFGGEIVNCDSLQVYRHFDIGTAKPGPAERAAVPHHLLDILEPDEVFTAGDYSRAARTVLAGITTRGRLPVVVGGTGFYLRALLEGLFAGPERNEALRTRLARRGRRQPGSLHRLLSAHDPQAAARIQPNDVQKLVRACEILLIARRPLTEQFAEGRDRLEGYCALKLGLDPPRTELFEGLNRRTERMFADGIIEEVKGVLDRGYPQTIKPLESIGYREALGVLRGALTREDAIALAQRNTRHYAKRQWTWFRREAEVRWLQGFGEDSAVREHAFQQVRTFLQNIQRVPG